MKILLGVNYDKFGLSEFFWEILFQIKGIN